MPPLRPSALPRLHPLAILPRDGALQPGLPRIQVRHRALRVPKKQDTIRRADSTRNVQISRPLDDTLLMACKAGLIGLNYQETTKLLDELQASRLVPSPIDIGLTLRSK
jgi:hypothetical protein